VLISDASAGMENRNEVLVHRFSFSIRYFGR